MLKFPATWHAKKRLALRAVLDKADMHDHVATFLHDPMVGRELIIVDAAASMPAARGKAPAPRPPPSALDAAKLCTMLGRSAGPPVRCMQALVGFNRQHWPQQNCAAGWAVVSLVVDSRVPSGSRKSLECAVGAAA